MRKISLIVLAVLILGGSFFALTKRVSANYVTGSVSVFCEEKGSGKNCSHAIWLGRTNPGYRIEWDFVGSGFGNAGPSGGKIGAYLCFSQNGAAWDGPCFRAIWDSEGPGSNICPPPDYWYWGRLGNARDCVYPHGIYEPGGLPPSYYYMVTDEYVNDGQLRGTVTFMGDICRFDSGASGCSTPDPGACSDGDDNDGDGFIDYPNDPGCTDPEDGDEFNNVDISGGGEVGESTCGSETCYIAPANPTINVGDIITFNFYHQDGTEVASGCRWYASPIPRGLQGPDDPEDQSIVTHTNVGIDARGTFRGVAEGVAQINCWAGSNYSTTLTVQNRPFTYRLTNSGNINVVKNSSGPTWGSVTIDRIKETGSAQPVSLAITSPASMPSGVSVASFTNVNCVPDPVCSSTITFEIDGDAPPSTPFVVTGTPNGIRTYFTLNTTGSGMSVVCTANPSPALVGENVTWTATVTGSNPPFNYSWNGDVPAVITPDYGSNNYTSSFTTSYTTTGLKRVLATVTDTLGNVARCTNGNNNGVAENGGGLLYVNFKPKFEEF